MCTRTGAGRGATSPLVGPLSNGHVLRYIQNFFEALKQRVPN